MFVIVATGQCRSVLFHKLGILLFTAYVHIVWKSQWVLVAAVLGTFLRLLTTPQAP